MKTSEPSIIILRNEEYPVEPGIPLSFALGLLHLDPQGYLAVRSGVLMQAGDVLQPGDRVKLISIIAGG